MTTILCDFRAVTGAPSTGSITVRATPDRATDGVWTTGETVPVPIVDGQATLTLVPGPCRVTVTVDSAEVTGREKAWTKAFTLTVPNEGEHQLSELMDLTVVWDPPRVEAAQKAAARAESEADRSKTEADRAEAAAEGLVVGVPDGGWPLTALAQEVLDEFGGGLTIPDGGWPGADLSADVRESLALADMAVQPTDPRLTDARPPTTHQHALADLAAPVQASLAKADSAVQGDDARLTDSRTPKAHKHPLSDLTTTGADVGMVATVGAGGVAAWAEAEGGGLPDWIAGGGMGGAASGSAGISIGGLAKAHLWTQTVVGAGAQSSFGVNNSSAFGRGANAGHTESSAIGAQSATTKPHQVMLGRSDQTVTMPGKAELGTGTTQVTLSTRLDAGKVQFGITWPGSSTFVPIVTQP